MAIDYSNFAFPKPGSKPAEPKKRAAKKPKPTREVRDKRTGETRLVLSAADWADLRRKYWRDHQKIFCVGCGKEIKDWNDFTFDHKEPRGMGAARRDDSMKNLRPMHSKCNTEKGSKRI